MTLPSGTITFLFTDIESSTKLWEQYPDAMHAALARHDALLHLAIAQHEGHVIKPLGDGFHAVFPTASQALMAVLEAQRTLLLKPGQSLSKFTLEWPCILALAEEAEPQLQGPDQVAWLAQLEAEHENLLWGCVYGRLDPVLLRAHSPVRFTHRLVRASDLESTGRSLAPALCPARITRHSICRRSAGERRSGGTISLRSAKQGSKNRSE